MKIFLTYLSIIAIIATASNAVKLDDDCIFCDMTAVGETAGTSANQPVEIISTTNAAKSVDIIDTSATLPVEIKGSTAISNKKWDKLPNGAAENLKEAYHG